MARTPARKKPAARSARPQGARAKPTSPAARKVKGKAKAKGAARKAAKPAAPRRASAVKFLRPDRSRAPTDRDVIVPCDDELVGQAFDLRSCTDVPRRGGGTARRCVKRPVVVAGCASPAPGKRAKRFFTVEEGMRFAVKDREIARALAEGAEIRARYGGEIPVAMAPPLRKPSCNALAKRVLAGKPVPPDSYERCADLPDAVEPGGFAPIPDFDPASFGDEPASKANDARRGLRGVREYEVFDRRSGAVVARVEATSHENAVRAWAQDMIRKHGSPHTGNRGREITRFLATHGARPTSKANHHGGYHAPGDPFGVYLPPVAAWQHHQDGSRTWYHPALRWTFIVTRQGMGFVREGLGDRERTILQLNRNHRTDGIDAAYQNLAAWYQHSAPAFVAYRYSHAAAKANGRAKSAPKAPKAPKPGRGEPLPAPGQSYLTSDADPFAGQRVTGDDFYGLVRNPMMACDGTKMPTHVVGGEIVTRGRVTGGIRRREIRDGLRPAPVRKPRATVAPRAASAMYAAPSQGGFVEEVTGEVINDDDDGPAYGGGSYGASAPIVIGEALASPPPPPPSRGGPAWTDTIGRAPLGLPAPRVAPPLGIPRAPAWLPAAEAQRGRTASPRFGAPGAEEALRIDPKALAERIDRFNRAWSGGIRSSDPRDFLLYSDAMTPDEARSFEINRVTVNDVDDARWAKNPQKALRDIARLLFRNEMLLARVAGRDNTAARERVAASRERERLETEATIAADAAAREREMAERVPELDVDPGRYGFRPNMRKGWDSVKKESVGVGEGWIKRVDGNWVVYTDSHAKMLALMIARQEGARPQAPAASRVPVLTFNAASGRFEVLGPVMETGLWQKLKDAGFSTTPLRGQTDPRTGKQAYGPWGTTAAVIARSMEQYADDAAKAKLAEIANVIAQSRAAEGVDCAQFPAPPGLAYLPYQCAGIAYALARQNTLIGDDMGLGKTVQALGVVNGDPSIHTVLVVASANALINWEREAKKWLVRPTSIYRIEETSDTIPANAQFVICNPDKLVDREYREKRDKTTGKVTPASVSVSKIREQLMARQWDLMVLDEAQFQKSRDSKQAEAVFGREEKSKQTGRYYLAAEGLMHRARRRIALTGTPIPNRVIELWNMVHALAPEHFSNFIHFAKRYTNAKEKSIGRGRTAWDFSGSANLDELQEKLRSILMVRRLKSQVLKELPPKRRQVVPLPIDAVRDLIEQSARALYQQMLQNEADGRDTSAFDGMFGVDATPEEIVEKWFERIDAMREEMAAAKARGDTLSYREIASKLRTFTEVGFESMSKARVELAVRKVPFVVEHVDQLLQSGTRKVVIMSHHHVVQDALVDAFANLYGANTVVMHRGGLSTDEKQTAVDRFQNDPNVRVFVGSIRASGTAITLTAADTMVFAELDWVPGNMSQAEDRIYRIGQTMPVLIQHLVFDGTLDAKFVDVLIKKQEVADLALDVETKRALLEDVTPPVRGPRDDMERWALKYMQDALSGAATIKPMSQWQANTARAAMETLGAEGGLTDRQWRFLAQNAAALSGASQRQVAEARGEVVRAATTEAEMWAAEAIGILSGQDTDRARERNGVGFSASDTYTGHTLNVLIGANMMTDRTWREAVEIARHYPAQVGYPPGYTPPAAGGAAAKPKRAPKAKKNGVQTVYGHRLPNPLGVRWVPPVILPRMAAPHARRGAPVPFRRKVR